MSSRHRPDCRDSDSKRHRSRFDQEPSPKRSRKHSRPEAERPPTTHNLDGGNNSERDLKHHRRLQDAVPPDASSAQDSKSERTVRKPSENVTVKDDGIKGPSDHNEGSRHRSSKNSSNPTEAPRSTSYFQHDERSSAGQVDRSSRHKAATEQGWWKDPKEHWNRTTTTDKQMNDEKSKVSKQNDVCRHDRYFEVKEDPKPPVKKRSFREEKIPVDTEKFEKAAMELVKSNPSHPEMDGGRKNEGAEHMSRHPGRYARPFTGERDGNRGETWRGKFPPRDKYHGNADYRARDRFNSRQGHYQSKVVKKWKHDLYDEGNKSPTPKNEEDQIAKIEALLAS